MNLSKLLKMAKVKVMGSKPYAGMILEEEDPSIVKLTDGWYNKRDPSVICIKNRFYRRNSPLLVELSISEYGNNNIVLREDTVEYEGEFYLKRDCNIEVLFSFKPFTISEHVVPSNIRGFPSIRLIPRDGNIVFGKFKPMTNEHIDSVLVRSLTGNHFLIEDDNYIEVTTSAILGGGRSSVVINVERKIHASELDHCLKNKNIYRFNGKFWWHTSLAFTFDYNGNRITPMCSNIEYKEMSKSDREKLVSKFCIEENKFSHMGQKSYIERVIFGVKE